MADITYGPVKVGQRQPFTISPVDANGNAVPGTYSWSVSDSTLAQLEVAADTLSASFVALGVGTVTVSVTDGNLVDTATGAIEVAIGPAVALNLAAGTPV